MASTERYTEVKRIFLEASRLPRGERTRYLYAQCAEDQQMAAQVRRLLTLDEDEPEFLETPALGGERGGLAPGTRLGRFTIVRMLGEGGMGVVYEAEEDEPRRVVALKVIRPGAVSERLRSRFRQEIRVLGQLRHPGIAQIYEAGTLELAGDRVPYFAMELVRGRPLFEAGQEKSLGLREKLALIAQICDAVHHAHQKGVIHRDLKPGNILVEEAEQTDSSSWSGAALGLQVKVLDFGIARATDANEGATRQTDPGQLVGTLPYMSPEQAAVEPDAVDTRSDVYSIGVIAFELLTGRLPYAVKGRQLLEAARIINVAEPTRLGTIDRALRGDIETIIAKALEKDRTHRYQSATELGGDIRRFLRDEPIVARPASALYQIRKFARRNRTLVLAAGLVFAAMAVATVVSIRQAGIAMRARSFAVEEQGRANLSAQVARREARRAFISAAAAAIEGGDPISARQSLESVEQGERGWAWQYWNARLDNSIAVIRPPKRAAAAHLMPGGDTIRVLTVDGHILDGGIWDPNLRPGPLLANAPVSAAVFVAGGERVIAACGPVYRSLDEFDACDGSLVRHIADLPARGAIIKASDDGAVVAVAIKTQTGSPIADDVWVWDHDAAGYKTRPSGRTTGMAITPDGRSLLFGFESGLLWESGTRGLRDHAGWSRAALRYAITADGARLGMGGEDKTVFIWGRTDGAPSLSLRGHAGDISAMAFNPSGAVLASAATDRTIRVWDAVTGKPLSTLMGHTAAVHDLEYSDDGSRLMSISNDGSIRVRTAQPYESTSILRGHSSYVYGVAFSSDGGRIVSGGWDGRAHIWDAAGGEHLRGLESAGAGYITAVAVSPDGKTIFTGHKTGEWESAQIYLWDAQTGSPRDHVSFGRAELHCLAINRAGTRLYTGWERGAVGILDLAAHPLVMDTLIPRHATFALALSPDERRVALGGSTGWVRIADTVTGEYLKGWAGHTGHVTALAWCPTRPLLASAGADSTIRVWNSETGELVAKLDRHWGKVYALAFSPDGDCLASGSDDTTIRIWDTASGGDLTQLRGHDEYVYSLAFSPDGRMLVSGSGDTTVRVWDTRPVHERWAGRAPLHK